MCRGEIGDNRSLACLTQPVNPHKIINNQWLPRHGDVHLVFGRNRDKTRIRNRHGTAAHDGHGVSTE